MYIGIEAGGTKFNCIIAEDPEHILAEKRIATTDPEQTIHETLQFIQQSAGSSHQKMTAIGIGSFGPLDLNPHSPNFGPSLPPQKLPGRISTSSTLLKMRSRFP